MKKLLFISFSVSILFSCVNDIDKKEYTNNLDHFSNLLDDINGLILQTLQ